jgi:hypothetical protein
MHQVKIEFRRIQTFLFASRRLRDMVGANVLLGELIRRNLPALADPAETVDLTFYARPGSAKADDPLASTVDPGDIDDPDALYQRGIFARDGGHFSIVFRTKLAAEAFRRAAESVILKQLPGLLFDIEITDLRTLAPKSVRAPRPPRETSPIDSPIFMACEATGQGPAAALYKFRDTNGRVVEEENVSDGVALRRAAYERFHDGKPTHDVIGLLASLAKPLKSPAKDFEALCGDDYLAVIHADGNDIGKDALKIAGAEAYDIAGFVQREARLETFFHANRVAFRGAAHEAVTDVFGGDKTPEHQLLMLGGDDLLLVCRAKKAFRFSVALADKLKTRERAPTVGIGIAIAARTVPFHHLHEIAEDLTKSAKRLYRRLAEDQRAASVVDWHIETGSWLLDPIHARARDLIRVSGAGDRRECFVLSRRPLPVLSASPEGDADHWSLQGMMRSAAALEQLVDALDDNRIARSQLRYLVRSLDHGRRWSDYALAATPQSFRSQLASPAIGLAELWKGADGAWTTAFRDIVEIFEVSRLGAPHRDGDAEGDAA